MIYDLPGGYCIYRRDNLISWFSKKEHVVARSSTVSEFKALANEAVEINYLWYLLSELKVKLNERLVLWCDNIGAGHLEPSTLR